MSLVNPTDNHLLLNVAVVFIDDVPLTVTNVVDVLYRITDTDKSM